MKKTLTKNTKVFALSMISTLAIMTMFSSTVASAQMYYYVNTVGELQLVEANTATLAISTASGIAMNSGVILASSLVYMHNPSTDDNDGTYAFVDKGGDIDYVEADSEEEALEVSDDEAASNSGVLDTETFDDSGSL